MHVFLWILFCLLASIGVVQAIGWLVCAMRRPVESNVCQVLELTRDKEALEAQLRYELFLMRWSTSWRPELVVLLDMGLDREGKEICARILDKAPGMMVCTPEELTGVLKGRAATASE